MIKYCHASNWKSNNCIHVSEWGLWRARGVRACRGLGAEPPVGSRGKAPGQGSGAKPPEAERLLVITDSNSMHKNVCLMHFHKSLFKQILSIKIKSTL
jgi:hypothetical protein